MVVGVRWQILAQKTLIFHDFVVEKFIKWHNILKQRINLMTDLYSKGELEAKGNFEILTREDAYVATRNKIQRSLAVCNEFEKIQFFDKLRDYYYQNKGRKESFMIGILEAYKDLFEEHNIKL